MSGAGGPAPGVPAAPGMVPVGPDGPDSPLPPGTRLVLDQRTRRTGPGGTILVGGLPGRVLRLSADGRRELDSLVAGTATSTSMAARRLGRRLVDGGLAHPRPPGVPGGTTPGPAGSTGPAGPAGPADHGRVTVVVPVRDRAEDLARCLGALDSGVPVVVVDDGSADSTAVADLCRRPGTTLVRRDAPGGPAAARNDGLARVATDLVAFVDSDCIPPPGWPASMAPWFADGRIGAVAPRVRPAPDAGAGAGRSVRARYAAARSPLDLGADEGLVGPGRPVPYVPTAALVARTGPLRDGFDPGLRYGEDVDLVWRLVDAGWQVRYVPTEEVAHREPGTWTGLAARRFRYGTSAAPLAARHPGRLAPVVLRPGPTALAALVLAGRPRVAAAAGVAAAVRTGRRLRGTGVPPVWAARWTVEGAFWSAVGLGRASTILAGPALVAAALAGRPRTRRAVVALALLPALVDWWRRRPDLDPLRWVAASLADDAAYGAGVWAGCLRGRTVAPLVPAFRPPDTGPPGDSGD